MPLLRNRVLQIAEGALNKYRAHIHTRGPLYEIFDCYMFSYPN